MTFVLKPLSVWVPPKNMQIPYPLRVPGPGIFEFVKWVINRNSSKSLRVSSKNPFDYLEIFESWLDIREIGYLTDSKK